MTNQFHAFLIEPRKIFAAGLLFIMPHSVAASGVTAAQIPDALVGSGDISQTVEISPSEMFILAEHLVAEGRIPDAEAVLEALADNPDLQIRSEARFRLGLLLSSLGRHVGAAQQFRSILDERPDTQRVRIELARVLALTGDERGARRVLRQVQASGLPPDVTLLVDQFANALLSRKPLGGSIEIALAPDSNINRATGARVLDTVIAPFELDGDARSKSGIGLQVAAQGYARLPAASNVNLLARASGFGRLYEASRFNDVAGSLLGGAEIISSRSRISASLGRTWRFYGQKSYAQTNALALNILHRLDPKSQIEVELGISDAKYRLNRLQDGLIYNGSISFDRALDAKSGFRISANLQRQDARDLGYASFGGGTGLFYYREIGNLTAFTGANVRWLEADERLLLYPKVRQDWYTSANAGASIRRLQLLGFSPLIRLTWERNSSTVGIYDYNRVSTEIGITRSF